MSDSTNEQNMVGTVLEGRFRIDEFIGAGGMGSVYQATQLNVNRKVAVKLIRVDEVTAVQAQRFEREARIMATFTHSNIVQFYDLGRTPDDVIFIVMEFVDGVPLGKLLREGRMSVDVCIDIGEQLFGALVEAHSRGIVHRDIKPDNMLLSAGTSGELRLKVLDFGLAHRSDDVRLTQAGRVSGTPYYIAPEMARGQAVTFKSDLYSAGVVLYEMLTGKPPFSGQSMQVMFKHVNDSPPTLSHWVEQGLMPRRLVELVMALLEKDPNQRPESATVLLAEFAKFNVAGKTASLQESTKVHPALDLATPDSRLSPSEVRQGSVPNLKAEKEVVGAWEAFNAAAESAPAPVLTMDPNIDSSFEFEGGFAESDIALAPASPRTVESVDQLSEIVIPAGTRVIATDQLQAVSGPAEVDSPSKEPASALAPAPAEKKPSLLSLRNQPTASTAQVHEKSKKKKSAATPIALFVVVASLLVVVGGALYTHFSETEPPPPASAEQEREWQRQKEEAEARQAAQAEAAKYVPPEEPAKKPKKKVAPRVNNGEVIELFENQDTMKETDRLKIERRK
jgi:serine/threonine protein kinase